MNEVLLKSNLTKKKTVLLTAIFFTLVIPALSFALIKFYQLQPAAANNNLLSPLSVTDPSQNPDSLPETQESKPETIYNLDYYLHLAKSFLSKATRIANNNTSQSDAEKAKIIAILNEALKAANNAIEYYPQDPEGYLVRAQVYQKVKHLWPELEEKAQKDLETANILMANDVKPPSNEAEAESLPTNESGVPLEKEAQPMNFIPTQKANLASNITIAEPKVKSGITQLADQESGLDTNADSGTGVLEAGQTEVIVKTNLVTNSAQIYVVSKGGADNQVVYVRAKKTGEWFKVGLDKSSDKDIVFKWWIINQ